jgi:hypothetical protein
MSLCDGHIGCPFDGLTREPLKSIDAPMAEGFDANCFADVQLARRGSTATGETRTHRARISWLAVLLIAVAEVAWGQRVLASSRSLLPGPCQPTSKTEPAPTPKVSHPEEWGVDGGGG